MIRFVFLKDKQTWPQERMEERLLFLVVQLVGDFGGRKLDLTLKRVVCVLFCFNCWAFRKYGTGKIKHIVSDQWLSKFGLWSPGIPCQGLGQSEVFS